MASIIGIIDALRDYESRLIYDIRVYTNTNLLRHNHPPMTGIVGECAYCKKFGNVFKKGTIPLHVPTLYPHVKSMR